MIARTYARTNIFMHTRTRTQIQSQRYPQQASCKNITFSQSRCVVLLPTAQEQIHVGYKSYI